MQSPWAARLHYLLQDIALPIGTFFIGRSADCQLSLDDNMVSRRHAALHVSADAASVEDLGSRNGVFLNGVRIEKSEPLHDADLIRIGSQDLAFYSGEELTLPASSRRDARVTRREMRVTQLAPHDPDDPDEQTYVATGPMTAVPGRAGTGLAIIGGVADKAFALGRADEAERVLQRSLADILSRAATGDVEPEQAEQAAGYALRLAAATGRGVWIDYGFRLYTALGALLPARLVDELYAAVRKVNHADKSVLRAYTARLREAAASFGPAERFVLQRIEGLERWAP